MVLTLFANSIIQIIIIYQNLRPESLSTLYPLMVISLTITVIFTPLFCYGACQRLWGQAPLLRDNLKISKVEIRPKKVKGLSLLRAFVSHRTIKDKKTKDAISGVERNWICRHQGPPRSKWELRTPQWIKDLLWCGERIKSPPHECPRGRQRPETPHGPHSLWHAP